MAAFAGFLVFLGLIGFAGAVVLLVIRALLKKGWAYKWTWMLVAVSIALFVTGMGIAGPTARQGYEAGRQATISNNEQTKTNFANQLLENQASSNTDTTQGDKSNQQPQQQTKQDIQESKEISKDRIPGIMSGDIKVSLESKGFKFTGPRPLQDGTGYLDDGKLKDASTGIELSCTISAENPTIIKTVIFRADGTLAAGTLSQDKYLSIAKGFLGYYATLPYDGAEQDKARKWVEDNIGNVKQGQPVEIKIGPAKYTLAGSTYFRMLSIKPDSNTK